MKPVRCNVWCTVTDEKLIELGLEEGNQWIPVAVDFSKVHAIKLAGENEFLGDDKTVLYFNADAMTVDLKFEDAIKIWYESNNL